MTVATLVAGCLVATTAGPAAAQAPPPTGTPVGTITAEARGAISGPVDIVADEDGNYWFTSTDNDAIGRVTSDGDVTMYGLPTAPTAITDPTEITMTGDGKLWFLATVGADDAIVSATLTAGVPTFAVVESGTPLVDNPQGITAGPSNSVWYTNASAGVADDGTIGRILPAALGTYAVDTFDNVAAGFAISDPSGITAGPDGNIWFADPTENTIGVIVPSLVPGFADITGATGAVDLAAGGDGRVWFTSPTTDSVGRVTITAGTPATYAVSLNIAAVTNPNDIVGGPDGNLWVTADSGALVTDPDSVVRVTPAGDVTPFTLPGIAVPLGITASPTEDELWFVNFGSDSIGRITTDGDLDLFTGANVDAPEDVAVTPDGSVWFTNAGNRTVGRIAPDGTTRSFPIPTGVTPGPLAFIAAAPDGDVWFTIRESVGGDDGGVGRVTALGDVDVWTSAGPPPLPAPPIPVDFDDPAGITVTRTGDVWVTDQGASPSIDRFTPGTDDVPGTAVSYSGLPFASVGESLTLGSDGNVWFTKLAGEIGRLTPAGGLASFTIAAPAARIITGWDGNLWFTVPAADAVGRMTTTGDTFLITDTGTDDHIDDPWGIAAGPQGDIWFVNTATVLAIPPATVNPHPSIGRIVEVADEPAGPTDYSVMHYPTTPAGLIDPEEIAAGTDGGMWFTSNADDAIGRIQAAAVPGRPDNVTAVAGDTQATVTWEAPENDGGMPITRYVVTSDPDGKMCTLEILDPSDPPDVLSCTVEALTNGTEYTFTVVAINAVGESLPSTPSNAVTPSGDLPPTGQMYVSLTPARLLDTRPEGVTVDGAEEGVGPIAAGTSYTFQVTGRAGVPSSGVGAVALNLTGTQGTAATYVTAYASGATMTLTSNLNLGPAETASNLAIVPVGSDGKVALYNHLGSQHVVADIEGYFPAGAGYNVLTPARVIDTRGSSPIGPGQTLTVPIAGQGGVPASGAGSVVINVTATGGTADTYLTVNPAATPPSSSNLNVARDQTIPNLVVAKLTDGNISIYNANGSQHVVADVFGWMPDGAGYTAMAPARALDTRPASPVGPNGTVDVQVTGVHGVPASGVDSVVVNITATGGTAATSVKAYPTGVTPPMVSNIPVAPGETVPNLAIVQVGTGGKITLANQNGNQHLVVDIQGYFAEAGPTPPVTTPTAPTSSTSTTLPPMVTPTTASRNVTATTLPSVLTSTTINIVQPGEWSQSPPLN